jgi:putative zinc finger protein
VDEMMQHDELDQLSAYIDGELDAAERSRLEAHVSTCTDCRTSLDALRMTIADLKTLPEEEPTEQDSWALRSAIARARKPAKRWQRYIVAAGSVAAVAIAFVAFVNGGSKGSRNDLEATGGGNNVGLVPVDQNFDKFSAQAHLLALTGKVSSAEDVQGYAPTAKSGGLPANQAPSQAPVTVDRQVQSFSAYDSSSGDLERCVRVVQSSTDDLLQPFRYEYARFDDKPAFFLVFVVTKSDGTAERYELWVMSADVKKPCETLFFSQTR